MGSIVSWRDEIRVPGCRTAEEVSGCPCSFPEGRCRVGYGWAMGLWCMICVGKCGCCAWPVPGSGPRTKCACMYPSPKGWFRAGCCWYMSESGEFPIGPSECRGHCIVAWFVLIWVIASVAAPRGWCCPMLCSGARGRPVCVFPSPGNVCRTGSGKAVEL